MVRFAELFVAPQDTIHERYAQLRESEGGVHFDDEVNAVFVMRYKDVETVFRHSEAFSNDTFWSSPAAIHDPADPRQVRFIEHFQNFLLFLDAPKHTRIRNIVRSAFTPAAVQSMGRIISDVTDQVLGEFDKGQEVDFMSRIAAQIPTRVIAQMVGVPVSDQAEFRRGTLAIIDTIEPRIQDQRRVDAIHEVTELIDYLADHIMRRRASTEQPHDLLTMVLHASEDDDRLTPEELLCMVLVLLGAGNTTTTDLLGNANVLLGANPAQHADLVANPQLMEQAIEEVVRMEPSLRWLLRKSVDDRIELGGKPVRQDTMVWLCSASANRDPRQFDRPEVFDIRRGTRRHLGFGSGVHYCLGAALARLEGRIVLTKFLERFPSCELLLDGPPAYKPDFISRSPAALPMLLG